MQRNVLIGAVAVVVIVAVILYVTLPGYQVEPEAELEGPFPLDEAYYLMSQGWSGEGLELDLIDLSDNQGVKAIPAATFAKVEANLNDFKAGLKIVSSYRVIHLVKGNFTKTPICS